MKWHLKEKAPEEFIKKFPEYPPLALRLLHDRGLDTQEKIDEQNVFPDSSRLFKNTLRSKALFGKYRITLNASYGDTGKVLTATVFTWIFPWRVVTAVILIILITILLLNKFYRQTKGRQDKLEEKLAEEEKELEALREKVKEQANQ